MLLSSAELAYQGIQSASTSPINLAITDGTTLLPITALPLDPCDQLLSTDEAIKEIMSFGEQHWEEWHIRGSTSDSDMMPLQVLPSDTKEIISTPYTSIQTLGVDENMDDTSRSLPIDSSVTTRTMEDTQISVDCSPEEIENSTCLHEEFHEEFV